MMEVDYSQGYIYKLVNDVDEDIYVGSSCCSESRRMDAHRTKARSGTTSLLYRRMRELGIDHFKLVRLEDFPCQSNDELRAREEYWRQELGAALNTVRCYLSDEEWKEWKKAYFVRYYAANREKILNRSAEYYKENKEKVQAYKKEYTAKNKELIQATSVRWRKENADKIQAKKAEQWATAINEGLHRCNPCDKSFGSKTHLTRHLTSKKHQDLIRV